MFCSNDGQHARSLPIGALRVAIQHPEKVRRLVVISTAYARDGWYPEVQAGMAAVNYGLWTGLAIASWRRFGAALPGAFSRRHRQLGWTVFAGLAFTALSATGMYVLAFVL
jgi:pimeloyl-ACP methyl ester carboxylesterase